MTDEVKKGRAVKRMAIILWRIAMIRPSLLYLVIGIVLGVLGTCVYLKWFLGLGGPLMSGWRG